MCFDNPASLSCSQPCWIVTAQQVLYRPHMPPCARSLEKFWYACWKPAAITIFLHWGCFLGLYGHSSSIVHLQHMLFPAKVLHQIKLTIGGGPAEGKRKLCLASSQEFSFRALWVELSFHPSPFFEHAVTKNLPARCFKYLLDSMLIFIQLL